MKSIIISDGKCVSRQPSVRMYSHLGKGEWMRERERERVRKQAENRFPTKTSTDYASTLADTFTQLCKLDSLLVLLVVNNRLVNIHLNCRHTAADSMESSRRRRNQAETRKEPQKTKAKRLNQNRLSHHKAASNGSGLLLLMLPPPPRRGLIY